MLSSWIANNCVFGHGCCLFRPSWPDPVTASRYCQHSLLYTPKLLESDGQTNYQANIITREQWLPFIIFHLAGSIEPEWKLSYNEFKEKTVSNYHVNVTRKFDGIHWIKRVSRILEKFIFWFRLLIQILGILRQILDFFPLSSFLCRISSIGEFEIDVAIIRWFNSKMASICFSYSLKQCHFPLARVRYWIYLLYLLRSSLAISFFLFQNAHQILMEIDGWWWLLQRNSSTEQVNSNLFPSNIQIVGRLWFLSAKGYTHSIIFH